MIGQCSMQSSCCSNVVIYIILFILTLALVVRLFDQTPTLD